MKVLNKVLLGLTLIGSLSAVSANGLDTYKKCAGCHGVNAEKKALGKSQVIQGWKATKTIEALNGYKDGTYGGSMKALMKGQVNPLTQADIEAVAKYIESKK